jgi:hypothetical protein
VLFQNRIEICVPESGVVRFLHDVTKMFLFQFIYDLRTRRSGNPFARIDLCHRRLPWVRNPDLGLDRKVACLGEAADESFDVRDELSVVSELSGRGIGYYNAFFLHVDDEKSLLRFHANRSSSSVSLDVSGLGLSGSGICWCGEWDARRASPVPKPDFEPTKAYATG